MAGFRTIKNCIAIAIICGISAIAGVFLILSEKSTNIKQVRKQNSLCCWMHTFKYISAYLIYIFWCFFFFTHLIHFTFTVQLLTPHPPLNPEVSCKHVWNMFDIVFKYSSDENRFYCLFVDQCLTTNSFISKYLSSIILVFPLECHEKLYHQVLLCVFILMSLSYASQFLSKVS